MSLQMLFSATRSTLYSHLDFKWDTFLIKIKHHPVRTVDKTSSLGTPPSLLLFWSTAQPSLDADIHQKNHVSIFLPSLKRLQDRNRIHCPPAGSSSLTLVEKPQFFRTMAGGVAQW